jgi:flagellar assembly protein FliH
MGNRFAGSADARAVDFGALGAAMSGMRGGFAENGPVHFSPAPEPKHFRPADPGFKPTAGWDPFDPLGERPKSDGAPDAIEAARADGFAEGMAAAERMAAERGEADAQALGRIAAALEATAGFDRDALAARLRQTVLFLVSRLIGEAGVSADLLTKRIEAAVALIADSAEPAMLRLNPDDLKLLEGHVPAPLLAVQDPAVERGAFRIETRSTAIEDGPAAWLNQLAAALDRAALPDGA